MFYACLFLGSQHILGNKKHSEEWKAKAEKGQKHDFRLFFDVFMPPTGRDSIRLFPFYNFPLFSFASAVCAIEN